MLHKRESNSTKHKRRIIKTKPHAVLHAVGSDLTSPSWPKEVNEDRHGDTAFHEEPHESGIFRESDLVRNPQVSRRLRHDADEHHESKHDRATVAK